MIISHVKIIAFQTIINHSLCIFYVGRKDNSFYNKQKNTRYCITQCNACITHTMYLYHAQKKLSIFAKIVAKMVAFSARNSNIYKICKRHKAIFSVFGNIFATTNFAILLILGSSF